VLDSLLASRTVSVTQLSGTSAGAINAAIVASALAKGTPADARRALRSFWLGVAKPAMADLGREVWGPVERAWRDTIQGWLVSSSAVSPYNANPLGINPLRAAIAAHVDIGRDSQSRRAGIVRDGDERENGPPARDFERGDDDRRAARVGRAAAALPGRWRSTANRTGTVAIPAIRRSGR
jgi:hypothetical protein